MPEVPPIATLFQADTAEHKRLADDANRKANWKRWGPYLADRQWGTVREDYSADGNVWNYLTHDESRSRAYRWGEDGLMGLCDREGRLHFGLSLWNGRDPILKERLFGLGGPEGNHGEDVKELYYFLDSSPTHSYMKGLYKYPQAEFPYNRLVQENAQRGRQDREFEIADTGVFDDQRYFDVFVEYAKASPDDILIKISIVNRGPEAAPLHFLPQLWFANNWSWGNTIEGSEPKPWIKAAGPNCVKTSHPTLGRFRMEFDSVTNQRPELLFTENDTNTRKLFGVQEGGRYVKDAFHAFIVDAQSQVVNPSASGTKMAAMYLLDVPAGKTITVRMRLRPDDPKGDARGDAFGNAFEQLIAQRQQECDTFYASLLPPELNEGEKQISRQAYAGLLWSKQFYHYVVAQWLDGDPEQPAPPPQRGYGRNKDWRHLFSRDVLSMPDAWEYPWFAMWDLAFHMVCFARLDPLFAKDQLTLVLREWYMHPNGQQPAYEFNFSDVNPPVHAWACWRTYKMTAPRGQRDTMFLERNFQKLLINFTWWVNRKDVAGKNIFGGGFLGLDNIGVFDRSKPLPDGATLEQADGTAWMAFYCGTMLSMAMELAQTNPAYEDIASKFFEHFVAIVDAMNCLGGAGLWDETDGFYYDQFQHDGITEIMRVRSIVGMIPLIAVEVLDQSTIDKLPGFKKRAKWFTDHRKDLAEHISFMKSGDDSTGKYLLAVPSKERLQRVLRYLFDENEFLSPHGIRSVSRFHKDHPFSIQMDGHTLSVDYEPGESRTNLFGGNSNWRGPIWFPINFLLLEALERYNYFYGDELKVEVPTGSGKFITLAEAAREIGVRLTSLFTPDAGGMRPCHGDDRRYADDANFKDLVLFYEHFDGDNGRGIGASHQTGWTALVVRCLQSLAARRRNSPTNPPTPDAAASRAQ